MDSLPAGLLSAGSDSVTTVPAALSGSSWSCLCSRRTALLQRSGAPQPQSSIRPPPSKGPWHRMGRLCKATFGGPNQVLAYLGRQTHLVAIANRRIIAVDDIHVAFRWKDYRRNGCEREKVMRLHAHPFDDFCWMSWRPASTACPTSASSLTVIDEI